MEKLISFALHCEGIFLTVYHCAQRTQRYAITHNIRNPTMTFAIAGGAVVARSFDPILSVQHSRQNIITGADFKQPRVKSLLERLVEFLNQKVQP